MPVAFEIPASGEVPYQYFEVPTNFKEDTWVQAVESRYGDPAHVHHLIVSVLPPENRRVRPENAIQVKSINLPGQQVNIRQRAPELCDLPGTRDRIDRGTGGVSAAGRRHSARQPRAWRRSAGVPRRDRPIDSGGFDAGISDALHGERDGGT